MQNPEHIPVLLKEVVAYLKPQPNQNFVDCTFGAAGHTQEILKLIAPAGRVLVIDLDQENLKKSLAKLGDDKKRVVGFHGNFKDIDQAIAENDFGSVNGILYDLGFSSMQMDGERGFSFASKERLDMRFDQTKDLSAYEVVNNWKEKELLRVIREYGEERFAANVVRGIVNVRKVKPIESGLELTEVVSRSIPRRFWPAKINPATKTFQAIRMAVNDELNNLRESLPKAITALATGGRIAVISFHSLEDRIVKDVFRAETKTCVCPPQFPKCICDTKPKLKIITKKIIQATEAEINSNPRARSAKLRVAEKL